MQVTETLSEGLKRELRVVVPASELATEMMEKLADVGKRAQIKGFRPGKVPVPHLKRLYGRSVMAELVQKHVDEGSKKVLEERKLKPAYQPEVTLPEDKDEVEKIFEGQSDFAYSMAFEVVPEFEVQDVSGLTLEKHVVAVDESHMTEALERLAKQWSTFQPKDSEAAAGDQLTISFLGKTGGEAFEGGTAEDVQIVLGSNQFIPGFEDQLLGVKAGEERTVNVTFPESYTVAALAGKAAEFVVTVSEVASPTVPAMDDELGKKLGYEDLGKLKDVLKQQLEREFGGMSAMKMKRDVLDALDKTYSFPLPRKLVDAEFGNIWAALTREMERAKKTFADEKTTEEEAREEYQKIAERRVRLGLVLGTMGEKQKIVIADDELQRALINRARQFPGQERQVLEFYQKNPGALIELRGPIFEQKVVDWIVSQATVTDKPVSREDLTKMVQDEEEDAIEGEPAPGVHDHEPLATTRGEAAEA